jgi:two-component system cell cycle response regulator
MTGTVLRILLVEDDEDDYLLTQAFLSELEDFQSEMTWAATYGAGMERLLAEDYDVILVDYHLGVQDGLAFVREALTLGCPSPIIILTGRGDRDVDLAAMRAGAVDYLEKDQITVPQLGRSLRYAAQRAHLLRSLRQLAVHDDLTGLFNRREFNRLLAEESTRCQRYGRTLGLLMFDIDRFKAINDTLGHLAGDAVLRHMAQALRERLRTVDRAARYGGDEFAVILPETTGAAAKEAADRLCQTVPETAAGRLKDEGLDLPVPLTLSMGVAELPRHAANSEELIDKADHALYAAKRRGGNTAVEAE